jgi:hypothetical protein
MRASQSRDNSGSGEIRSQVAVALRISAQKIVSHNRIKEELVLVLSGLDCVCLGMRATAAAVLGIFHLRVCIEASIRLGARAWVNAVSNSDERNATKTLNQSACLLRS